MHWPIPLQSPLLCCLRPEKYTKQEEAPKLFWGLSWMLLLWEKKHPKKPRTILKHGRPSTHRRECGGYLRAAPSQDHAAAGCWTSPLCLFHSPNTRTSSRRCCFISISTLSISTLSFSTLHFSTS